MATIENDLTQSRILLGKEFRISLFNDTSLRWFKNRSNLMKQTYGYTKKDFQLVLTGNSEERELKRLWWTRENPTCECCGFEIKRKPYDKDTGNLCIKCYIYLEKEYSKKDKYGFKIKPAMTSTIIRNDGFTRNVPRIYEKVLNEYES